jgi:hypothetical protein
LPGELWRILQLPFRDPGPVAAKGWIIMELCAWDRMKISLEAQEAAERSDRIQTCPLTFSITSRLIVPIRLPLAS